MQSAPSINVPCSDGNLVVCVWIMVAYSLVLNCPKPLYMKNSEQNQLHVECEVVIDGKRNT